MHVESLSTCLCDASDSFRFSDTSSLCLSCRNISLVSAPQNFTKHKAGKRVNLSSGSLANRRRGTVLPPQSLTSIEREILCPAPAYGLSLSFRPQLLQSRYRHAHSWCHPKRWKRHQRTHLTYTSALGLASWKLSRSNAPGVLHKFGNVIFEEQIDSPLTRSRAKNDPSSK